MRLRSEDDMAKALKTGDRAYVDKAAKSHEWGIETDPSAGYIACLLWGGEPGRRWADSLMASLNKTAAE
jgi:hypothetical protein